MKSILTKIMTCLFVFTLCITLTSAASYTRTVFFMQKYNNVGGATKQTTLNYISMSGLSLSGASALTFTPIDSQGNFKGSSVTVYDGHNGNFTHTISKGQFVDMTFRNHHYSLSNGTVAFNINWN